jgi:hypothetical protein
MALSIIAQDFSIRAIGHALAIFAYRIFSAVTGAAFFMAIAVVSQYLPLAAALVGVYASSISANFCRRAVSIAAVFIALAVAP